MAQISDRIPFRVQPMLATLTDRPFHRAGWIYEEKYDGFRILAYKEHSKVTLLSRNDKDRTATYAAIADAIKLLRPRTLLLDGEAVAFDQHRISRFQLLQQGKAPVYAVFDCLYKDGQDLRSEPLAKRRTVLEALLEKAPPRLFPSRRLAENGLDAYRNAKQHGFEGLIAKDASAPYAEGRSSRWLKVKVHQEDEFVIVGYTAPQGTRQYFGALLLGAYDVGKLRYVGKVGTGFTRATLSSLHRSFRPLVQDRPALVDPPREKDVVYLKPKLVAQIAYQELTADDKLRQPVFLGLRDDKRPEECLLPRPQGTSGRLANLGG